MNYGQANKKLILISLFVLVAIFMIFTIFKAINNIDKQRVSIEVIPEEAKVYMNNTELKSKSLYLYPGEYKFTAKSDGWLDYETTIIVDKGEDTTVGLIPEPDSDKSKRWLEDNPDIQQVRESIGGQSFTNEGEVVAEKNPLISSLPYEDIYGPFSVNYGESYISKDIFTIQVGSSTPPGRKKFLEWLIQQGQDPTDLEIEYQDYINPFRESEQA